MGSSVAKVLKDDSDSDEDDDHVGDNVLEDINDKLAHTTESLAEAMERRRKDQVINDTRRAGERMRKKYHLDHKQDTRNDDPTDEDDRKAKKNKKAHSGSTKSTSHHDNPSPKKKSEEADAEAIMKEERRRDDLERNKKVAERMRQKYARS